MKLLLTKQRNHGLTRRDVLVVILMVVVLLTLFTSIVFRINRPDRERVLQLTCAVNLRQIGLAARIWEGDNGGKYPMAVSITNGGAMELIATGNVVACFQVMSNELATTKILWCPADTNRTYAANFDELNHSHISYFLGVDVTNDANYYLILAGDDNLELNGSPVKSGVVNISTNFLITWSAGRHTQTFKRHFWSSSETVYLGNMGFADGPVQDFRDWQLRKQFQYIETGTNRLAFP
jgi:hypothetical protein